MDENIEKKRTKTEVYSRCCGYLRPVDSWNDGKQAEYGDRITFEVKDYSLEKN